MEKKVFSGMMLGFAVLLMVLPIVLAYDGGGWGVWGYYRSPLMYLDNEWVMFSIFMLVFFGIIFYTVNKAFKNNVVSGVIALALSLLITITILRRGFLYGYMGDELGGWILVAVVLIAFGFLIRFAYKAFGVAGSTITVVVIWLLLQRADPYEFLPYGVSEGIVWGYEFIASFIGLVILVLIAIFAAPFLEGKSPIEKMIESAGKSNLFRR